MGGALAFRRVEVRCRPGLSTDQEQLIDELLARGRDAIGKAGNVPVSLGVTAGESADWGKAFSAATRTPEVQLQKERARHEVDALSRQYLESVLKILTDRQREAYRGMLGEPFDASLLDR